MDARDWLIDGARGASSALEVLAGTCERLAAGGVPIARAEAYVRTLHPQFQGRAFVWTPAAGCVAVEERYGAATSRSIQRVIETRATVRHDPSEHPGLTDAIAVPFVFTTGEIHACVFFTDRPSGFEPAAIAILEAVIAPLARLAEIFALRRTAANVLTAYVGRDAGTRVLAGQIRRGDTELIEAAIWFSDMRGFSATSNDKHPREVIELLNELFDCQVPAIERHGGEVLKFIGDGLLAIFAPRGDAMVDCCTRALAATRDAFGALAERNAHRPPIKFGVALHVGEVAYGNIGGAARLDFTCIGRAVNLAARLESLTGALGHDVLASEAFAALCGGMTRVGAFPVKGFAEPLAAYQP